MKNKKTNLQYTPLVLAAILAGIFIGILKFVVENYIGFELIIVFSFAYGYLLYKLVEKIFCYNTSIWNNKAALVAVTLAMIAVPLTFYALDYKHMESEVLKYVAEDVSNQGASYTQVHFGLEHYLLLRSGSSSVSPLLFPMVSFRWITLIVDFIEFAIIGYVFYLGARSKIHFKHDEDL